MGPQVANSIWDINTVTRTRCGKSASTSAISCNLRSNLTNPLHRYAFTPYNN